MTIEGGGHELSRRQALKEIAAAAAIPTLGGGKLAVGALVFTGAIFTTLEKAAASLESDKEFAEVDMVLKEVLHKDPFVVSRIEELRKSHEDKPQFLKGAIALVVAEVAIKNNITFVNALQKKEFIVRAYDALSTFKSNDRFVFTLEEMNEVKNILMRIYEHAGKYQKKNLPAV